MKIVSKASKVGELNPVFEDLDSGQTFRVVGEGQVQIKCDDGDTSVCLETGELNDYAESEQVIRVACELHILS